jgi:hypothetical protein
MNDHFEADRRLESLAARLSSLAPKLADDEQRELLYRCAFGAGAKSARGRVAFWRNMCAGLAVLFGGTMAFTIGPAAQQVATSDPRPETTNLDGSLQVSEPLSTANPAVGVRPIESPEPVLVRASLRLDAWDSRPDGLAAADEVFDRLQKLGPTARSHTVTVLQRAL